MTQLHIPKPCHEDWSAMTPNGQGRHCGSCDKTVVDVTRMAPPAATRFLGEVRAALPRGREVCVRAHADRSGRLLTPSATRRLLTNGLAAVIAMTMAGCQGEGPKVSQAAQTPSSATSASATTSSAVEIAPTPTQTAQQPVVMGEVTCAPHHVVKGEVAAVPTPEPGVMMGLPVPVDPTPVTRAPAPAQEPEVVKGKVVASPDGDGTTPAP